MRITDIIRDFISNIRTKKLPPPKQVDTKVIPIICGKKDSERILSVIKNEIDKYSDFYKVFLKEYDGICLNGAENGFTNPLTIEDICIIKKSSTFINPQDNTRKTTFYTDEKIASIILAQFGNGILAKYNNQGYGLIFEEMRKEYKNELKYSHSNENFEEIFYQSIIKKMRFLTTTSIYAK